MFYLPEIVLKLLTMLERNSILQYGLPVSVCHEYTVAIPLYRRLSPEMYVLTYLYEAFGVVIYIHIYMYIYI